MANDPPTCGVSVSTRRLPVSRTIRSLDGPGSIVPTRRSRESRMISRPSVPWSIVPVPPSRRISQDVAVRPLTVGSPGAASLCVADHIVLGKDGRSDAAEGRGRHQEQPD